MRSSRSGVCVHYSSLCYFPLTYLAALQLERIWTRNEAFGWSRFVLGILGNVIAVMVMAVPFIGMHIDRLRGLLAADPFAQANLDTALIQREQAVLFKQEPVDLPLAAAAAVAQTLIEEKATEGVDPFSRRDGWRSHGVTVRRFAFEFHGESAPAALTYLHDGALHLAVGGASGTLQFSAGERGIDVQFAGQRATVQVHAQGEVDHVFTPQGATQITSVDLLAHAGESHAEGGRLTAPMPGKVVSFAVKAGDKVAKGQALAVMEAMKMEHTIAAPADGTVAELLYAPGDQVAEGAELLKLAQ